MLLRVATLAVLMLLVGCRDDADRIAPDGGAVIATVNGQPIHMSLLDAWARARQADLEHPQVRAMAIRELTDYLLLAGEAHRQGFPRRDDFAADVEIARLQGTANAAVRAMRDQAHIDDTAIQHEYQRRILETGPVEYDFSHLLFADEDSAFVAVGEVLAGEPFAQVFAAHGDSAQLARHHQRVNRMQLPPAIADALQAMAVGEISTVPVRSELGWHVLHVDAVHDLEPPPLDDLRDGIRAALRAELAQTRLQELRDTAEVTMDESVAARFAADPADAPGDVSGD